MILSFSPGAQEENDGDHDGQHGDRSGAEGQGQGLRIAAFNQGRVRSSAASMMPSNEVLKLTLLNGWLTW